MGLCPNRPEGFGPTSHLSSPLPTTCFIDTILIPLPIWISLILLPILYILTRRSSSLSGHYAVSNPQESSSPPLREVDETKTTRTSKRMRVRKVRLGMEIIYYLLIIAQILMITLIIVRLSLAHLGVGLIPFAYVGLLLAFLLHFFHHPPTNSSRHPRNNGFSLRYWRTINLLLWTGGLTMSIISAASLAMQPGEVKDRRKGSKYKVVDEITDLAVMAGVYAVLGALEVGLWLVGRKEGLGRGWRRDEEREGVGRQDGEEEKPVVEVVRGKEGDV